MKSIFTSFYSFFLILGLITHFWTFIIAIQEAGFWGGIISLFLPVLSELYWMVKMFGENDLFAYAVLVQLIFGLILSVFFSPRR
jgi:hypothetical protein